MIFVRLRFVSAFKRIFWGKDKGLHYQLHSEPTAREPKKPVRRVHERGDIIRI